MFAFKRRALLTGSICCLICYLTLSIISKNSESSNKVETNEGTEVEERKQKIILYWTKYYDRDDFTFGFGINPFTRGNCPVNNCFGTNDRNLLNESDAILFHSLQFNPNDLPPYRQSHQRYIFYLFETMPFAWDLAAFSKPDFFNWTMTYRRDSDVYMAEPYGMIRRKKDVDPHTQFPPVLGPENRPLLPEALVTKKQYPELVNRTKLIAWFVSHCSTHSKREDYFKELGKYIQIDIYGKCGQLECLPRNGHNCETLLDHYKFYVAAENSVCADYVTEKFYRTLSKNLIPIVYGGADYTQYAPPHSYINVADFNSPKDLANYLILLDKNPDLYMKYFWWKQEYEVIRAPLDGLCDLCRKLNDPKSPVKSYHNLSVWWIAEIPCFPGSSFTKLLLGHQ